MRLDQYLSTNYSYSRTKAQQLITSGFIKVNNTVVNKVSFDIKDDDSIQIVQDFQFASLGGDKLEKALADFNYDLKEKTCIDIGASNGGFTDCMLQHGAKKVYALDVGECALPDYLKLDDRVIVKDRLNARNVTIKDIGEYCDFASIDVSFISLKLVLNAVKNLLTDNGEIIALIKPQFEVGQKFLTKKGIVNSQKAIDNVIEDIKAFALSIGLKTINITNAPIKPKKNKEYLIYLSK